MYTDKALHTIQYVYTKTKIEQPKRCVMFKLHAELSRTLSLQALRFCYSGICSYLMRIRNVLENSNKWIAIGNLRIFPCPVPKPITNIYLHYVFPS